LTIKVLYFTQLLESEELLDDRAPRLFFLFAFRSDFFLFLAPLLRDRLRLLPLLLRLRCFPRSGDELLDLDFLLGDLVFLRGDLLLRRGDLLFRLGDDLLLLRGDLLLRRGERLRRRGDGNLLGRHGAGLPMFLIGDLDLLLNGLRRLGELPRRGDRLLRGEFRLCRGDLLLLLELFLRPVDSRRPGDPLLFLPLSGDLLSFLAGLLLLPPGDGDVFLGA
jgi:hypothetical protein